MSIQIGEFNPVEFFNTTQDEVEMERNLIHDAKMLLLTENSLSLSMFLDAIRRAVAVTCIVEVDFCEQRIRKREYVYARYQMAYLLWLVFSNNVTNEQYGRWIGNYDHATFNHARKNVLNNIQTDREYAKRFISLWKQTKVLLNDAIYHAENNGYMSNYERELHKAVVTYIKMQYPKVLFNTDLSGVFTTPATAKQVSQLRSRKGHPDLMIYEPRGGYYGLFVELKANGVKVHNQNGDIVASDHIRTQAEYLEELNQRGYMAVFAVGFDAAKRVIDSYLNL